MSISLEEMGKRYHDRIKTGKEIKEKSMDSKILHTKILVTGVEAPIRTNKAGKKYHAVIIHCTKINGGEKKSKVITEYNRHFWGIVNTLEVDAVFDVTMKKEDGYFNWTKITLISRRIAGKTEEMPLPEEDE